MTQDSTHFGFKQVPTALKSTHVKHVFDQVAHRYDIMNDVMSGGLHHLWKKFTIACSGARLNHTVLDIAGGTGDLTRAFSTIVGPTGRVILSDINDVMLKQGRNQLLDQGLYHNITYVQADAECLPFKENYFNEITMAFGLRNVTNKEQALSALYSVLKPGGKILILEFSKPFKPIAKLYDLYSFHIIPELGEWIGKNRAGYEYLVESIRMHPDQETLKTMMETAGFEDVHYHQLTFGIVALHIGFKY